jgi:hypothetical protein
MRQAAAANRGVAEVPNLSLWLPSIIHQEVESSRKAVKGAA